MQDKRKCKTEDRKCKSGIKSSEGISDCGGDISKKYAVHGINVEKTRHGLGREQRESQLSGKY